MTEPSRRRLLVALARAEDALVETHVRNVLDVFDAVGDELDLRAVLEQYVEALEPGEERAPIIVRRVLARLEENETGRPLRTKRRPARG